jgi:acyl phosphate:glycerol-3-phosphate acyltransferase
MESILAVAAGYLLGSFPSAYIAGRMVKGKDIRRIGGGNMGTLNVLREIGFLPGLMVFLADVAKGTLAVLVAGWLGVSQLAVFMTGAAAVAGHNWPVWLDFRGGRGGATTYGVLLGLAPPEAAIAFGVMCLIMILTSNGRLALMGGFVIIPLVVWLRHGTSALITFTIVLPFLLGFHMLLSERGKLSHADTRQSLIVDHGYTFWQKRRHEHEDKPGSGND